MSQLWKNSEDAVLKGAVMKYGLRGQWGRIASLFPHKSAKMCKARWYNWLSPTIKKTDWTLEEEEKLLYLSKLFPRQWTTISTRIGRTPLQCITHYERLLESAATGKLLDPSQKSTREQLMRSQSQYDVNVASLPALPDTIDLAESEREIITEARARFANNLGKKQKRRIREEKIRLAKRKAAIQEIREFRTAGLSMETRLTKTRTPRSIASNVNYLKETAFEHQAKSGPFSTGASLNISDLDQLLALQKSFIQKQETLKKLKEQEIQKQMGNLDQIDTSAIDAWKNSSAQIILSKSKKSSNGSTLGSGFTGETPLWDHFRAQETPMSTSSTTYDLRIAFQTLPKPIYSPSDYLLTAPQISSLSTYSNHSNQLIDENKEKNSNLYYNRLAQSMIAKQLDLGQPFSDSKYLKQAKDILNKSYLEHQNAPKDLKDPQKESVTIHMETYSKLSEPYKDQVASLIQKIRALSAQIKGTKEINQILTEMHLSEQHCLVSRISTLERKIHNAQKLNLELQQKYCKIYQQN